MGARRSRYVGVFLVVMFGLLALFNAVKPRVLVLHKDRRGDAWTAQVDAGIRRVLGENRRPINISWHYLGLDQKASAAAKVAAVNDARRAVAQFDPDVLIAVDDESNELVASEHAGQKRPKVIYVSIDLPPAHYGYGTASNVSGISEVLPLTAIRDAVMAVRGGRPCRLAAVGSDCETGRAELSQVRAFDWTPCNLGYTSLSRTLSDFQGAVEKAGFEAEVMLVLTFEGLTQPDGSIAPDRAVASWVEQSSRAFPLGLRHEYVAEGGGFAFTSAGDEEGAEAMQMALTWLDRPWLSRAPEPVTSQAFDVMMRAGLVDKRGVKIPPIYREAARSAGHLYP